MDQSRLNPQDQATLFELMKRAGSQPTAGGMDQTVSDPGAQMAPGSFANNPQGAMDAISKILMQKSSGPQLSPTENGLQAQLPSSNPLKKLFGMKDKVPVTGANYFDSLNNAIGAEQVANLLPAGVPKAPDGSPYISAAIAEKIQEMAKLRASKATLAEEMPSKELASGVLAKAKDIYGETSERFKTLQAFLEKNGGVSLKNLPELNSSLVTPTKEIDQFTTPYGPAFRDRGTGQIIYPLDPKTSPVATSVITKEGDRYGGDKVVQDLRGLISQLPSFETLLDSNNPAARGSIEGFAARVLGREKGVMTDQDIYRNTGSRALADRFERWVTTHAKGNLDETDIHDFTSLMRDIRGASEKTLKATEDSYVKRASAAFKRLNIPITDDELRDQITLQATYQIYNGSDNPLAQHLTGVTPKAPAEPAPKGVTTAQDYMNKFNKGKK